MWMVEISLVHSPNSVGVCSRPKNTSTKHAGVVGPVIARAFLERREGPKKDPFSKDGGIVHRSLQVTSAQEENRQRPAAFFSPPHLRSEHYGLARRTMPLTSAGDGSHGTRQTWPGRPNVNPFQRGTEEEAGIRAPPRASLAERTPDENHPGELIKAWQDGPYGVVWEVEEIAQAVDGVIVATASSGSISTDSRRINRGEWFLALVGPNFDGHEFVQQALDRGCAGVIGRAVSADWPRGFIRVEDDTLRALHRLAACVRRRYGGAVVGITGSVGKTTARAMTALALESLGTIHQTEGNFNNHIGLPLTLLKLPSAASACVLEMGMNHTGEILALAAIAQPSVRVILNVGLAHMEHFSSLEAVAAAKGELLSRARAGDVCVLNADDPLVMSLAIPAGVRVVMFGRQDGCHVRIADAEATRARDAVQVVLEQFHPASTWVEYPSNGSQILEHLRESSRRSNISCSPSSTSFTRSPEDHGSGLQPRTCINNGTIHLPSDQDSVGIEMCASPSSPNLISRVKFKVPSPGLHLAMNACAAAAVAVTLGLPLQTASESLSRYVPIGMRTRWEKVGGGIQLINDAYNSNPMSIESGLKLLGSMECQGRRIALLGDMLELGSVSKKAHLDALALCQELNFEMVGLVGPSFSEAARSQGLDREKWVFMICENSQELAAKVVECLRHGDLVLVKGSRGLKMEVVANSIRTYAGQRQL